MVLPKLHVRILPTHVCVIQATQKVCNGESLAGELEKLTDPTHLDES